MWILWTVLGLLALLLSVILIRTAAFKPKKPTFANVDAIDAPVNFDHDDAVAALQQLLRCKTISYFDRSLEDDAEFDKLIELLPSLYPEVYATCSLTRLPDRALLFCWQGKAHDAPSVMMAHYDVVPVDEASWQKPPFEGIIENGELWGRGALDTKITFSSVLFAANTLIKQGFVPAQDMYFAFSGGEEINDDGALHIVNYFKQNGITPHWFSTKAVPS
jgi:carboxypeptidase PM20D1